MPSRVWACNLDQISALSVSRLDYPIENNSNPVLESGWRCGRVQMAWWVSGLIGQGLGLASLRNGELQSTKIIFILTSLWWMLSPFVLKYAMCVRIIHSKIGVHRERQIFWNRSRGSIRGHFYRLISCQTWSETGGVGSSRLIWIFLALTW